MLKLFYSTSSAGGFFTPRAHNQTGRQRWILCLPVFVRSGDGPPAAYEEGLSPEKDCHGGQEDRAGRRPEERAR